MLYNLIFSLNVYLLLFASVFFAWLSNITSNAFAKISKPNEHELYFGLIVKQIFGALILLAVFGFRMPSLFTVAVAFLFSLCIALSVWANQLALCYGPMTICVMVGSSGTMMINAIFGAVFWHEKLSVFKIVGIVGMAIMMYFVIGIKSEGQKPPKKYYIMTAIATIFSVSVGFIQKLQQNSDYKSEFGEFLILSFVFSSLIIAVIMFSRKSKAPKISFSKIFGGKTLAFLLLSGLSYSAIHTLNLYLSGKLESTVFFPIANGGPMIFTVIAAVFLFRERPSKKQVLGVVIGIASILLLGEVWK